MILSPWFWLAVAVWTAIVGAGGYRLGGKVERASFLDRKNAQLVAANAEIQRLNDAVKREHRQHELRLGAIATDFAKERTAHETLKRADRDRALSGDVRLRVATPTACPGGADGTPAATGRGDGPAPGELPREIAAALFDIANDADEVVAQLSACQRVIESDRRKDSQ